MLRTLTVTNFKRFKEEMRIDFEPVTVLIGANNSGKSTVLQALNIFQYCIDVTRKKKNGGVGLEKLTISPEDFAPLPVASPTDLWPSAKPASGPIRIKAQLDNDATIAFEIKLSFNRFSISPEITGDAETAITGTQIRYVPIHSGLALREEYLLAPARTERVRELQHGSVIRNLLWDLKENRKDRWKLLKGILGRLYPMASIDVNFDKDLDRFISAEFRDGGLNKSLDVLSAGTGFQQVLQIFSSVLSQTSGTVLLDEPDAHLHARLQVELMRVFDDLVKDESLQFILATHSPHLVAAAPPASLRAMVNNQAHAFALNPEQVDVLDSLGAFDRMEVVPLLRTKAVVFVENRDDRDLLELFARKVWSQEKAREVFDQLSFLYTYQEPIAADVKRLARQVRDLLDAPGLKELAGGRVRFLVLGDRDYRPEAALAEEQKKLANAAKSQAFGLELKCHIWSRNEIENYLLDAKAIEAAAMGSLPSAVSRLECRKVVRKALAETLAASRETVRDRVAEQILRADRALGYMGATNAARAVIEDEWGDGSSLADAKQVLSAVRSALQANKLKARLTEADIIANLPEVPQEVRAVLNNLARLARPARPKKTRKAASVRATEA